MTTLKFVDHPPESTVVEAGVKTVQTAVERIFSELKNNPQALDRLWHERLKKNLLTVDLVVETAAREYLASYLQRRVEIRGEESSLAPVTNASVAALLDMLDGSDLLERGLGNWCSALVLFDSKRHRVITAVIGLPSRVIYYTKHSKKDRVFRRLPLDQDNSLVKEPSIERVKMPPRNIRLRDASVAFYGQKPRGLLSVFDASGLMKRFREIADEAASPELRVEAPRLRLYNLAGNPMMISLIEGKVDAIVELNGQRCHDVIPGFVIALRAGATLLDLAGNVITEEDLAKKVADPEHRFQYVLSCNKELGGELLDALKGSKGK